MVTLLKITEELNRRVVGQISRMDFYCLNQRNFGQRRVSPQVDRVCNRKSVPVFLSFKLHKFGISINPEECPSLIFHQPTGFQRGALPQVLMKARRGHPFGLMQIPKMPNLCSSKGKKPGTLFLLHTLSTQGGALPQEQFLWDRRYIPRRPRISIN